MRTAKSRLEGGRRRYVEAMLTTGELVLVIGRNMAYKGALVRMAFGALTV